MAGIKPQDSRSLENMKQDKYLAPQVTAKHTLDVQYSNWYKQRTKKILKVAKVKRNIYRGTKIKVTAEKPCKQRND